MSISTDEAKRARAKAKRAARKAARKVKVDKAKARDAKIEAFELSSVRWIKKEPPTPRPENIPYPWEYDSRRPPPPPPPEKGRPSYRWDNGLHKWVLPPEVRQ